VACGASGKIVRSPYGVVHGKSSLVYYDEKGEDGLFFGLSKYVCIPSLAFLFYKYSRGLFFCQAMRWISVGQMQLCA